MRDGFAPTSRQTFRKSWGFSSPQGQRGGRFVVRGKNLVVHAKVYVGYCRPKIWRKGEDSNLR